MKALVIYDSAFGNTEQIAQAMGQALGSQPDVEVLRVTNVQAEQLRDLDVLVVGSPTRAFQASLNTKKFLSSIPARGLEGVSVGAFDTRLDAEASDSAILAFLARLFGYAAEPIGRRLLKRGGNLTLQPKI